MTILRVAKKVTGLLVTESLRIFLLLLFIAFEQKSRKGTRKVMFFGVPIISGKYIVESIKDITDNAITFVPEVYSIHPETDFNYVSKNPLKFLMAVKEHNIYLIFYDSLAVFFGPVSKYFFKIYKTLKSKKIIVMPYGSDAFVYSKISDYNLRHVLNTDYPRLGLNEEYIQKRYFWINKLADFRIPCIIHIMTLSSWDILPVHYYPFDIDKMDEIRRKVAKYDVFTILHSPNHRGVKGTEYIMEAVNQLILEGYKIRIKLLEKIANKEVLIELAGSHLLIEQVVGGLALSAMEGMAAGLPVIANMNLPQNEVFRRYSYLNQCPIVNAALDVKSIKEAIIFAMNNYEELSKKSYAYAKKYHSYEANQIIWRNIFEALDKGERLCNYFHPIIGKYEKDYEDYQNKQSKQFD